MRWIHYPKFRDKWIPDDEEEFLKLIELVARDVLDGKRVLIHCNGGKGRTGTLVAALLMTAMWRPLPLLLVPTRAHHPRRGLGGPASFFKVF